MLIGRVIGDIVSTVCDTSFEGKKLLLIQPLDPEGGEYGDSLVAADSVQAGLGETVLLLWEGSSARLCFGMDSAPVRTMVVGVIDSVDLEPLESALSGE